MFDNLTNKLSRTLYSISNCGRLTEDNIKKALQKVRVALLEADVALSVVRKFIQLVKESAIGQDFNKGLTPGQEFIKIVKNKLTKIMGEENRVLNLAVQPPAVILVTGLKGAGKTTTVAKLGKILKEKQRKKVLTVSADVYRPAAIRQLEVLTQIAGIDFFSSVLNEIPVEIVTNALQYAKLKFYDVLIVDTAGCYHVDKFVMDEIKAIYHSINPIETLFIADAMTGQDAANSTKFFNEALPLTGVILTKTDGDVRGGAALSVRYITGKPIKFLGTGEKIDSLEPFYPDRIASRILGMGDVLSLIEDIESKIDPENVKKLTHKFKKSGLFTLNDFLEQLKQIRHMDGMTSMLSKIPGIVQLNGVTKLQMNDHLLVKMEAIISSMTIRERQKPEIIKGSHKRRIAAGSGTQVQDVNQLLKQFSTMQYMIKKIKKDGIINIMRGIKGIITPD